jgi:hypothetical protein
MSKLFPDTNIQLVSGVIQESGTSVVEGHKNQNPQRWIKVENKVFVGLDDGLYHAQYGQKVDIAYDSNHKVVGYWNHALNTGSETSKSGMIGAVALALILTAIGYYGGVWNFIWKGINEWWLTIFIIFIFSLYAIVWTPIFAYKESKRERLAHELLKGVRGN